jgi:hypothetical protein
MYNDKFLEFYKNPRNFTLVDMTGIHPKDLRHHTEEQAWDIAFDQFRQDEVRMLTESKGTFRAELEAEMKAHEVAKKMASAGLDVSQTSLEKQLQADTATEVDWLIDDVMFRGCRLGLLAKYKAGKTTLVDNLIRSLVDGEPFLGGFNVPKPLNVHLIDTEMNNQMRLRWMAEQGIKNTGNVIVWNVRDRNVFDLNNPGFVKYLKEHTRHFKTDVLIIDCLNPLLESMGLQESNDTIRHVIKILYNIVSDLNVSLIYVHHTGYEGSRARNASVFHDVSDTVIKLGHRDSEPATSSVRYIQVYGRDTNHPRCDLVYEEEERRLNIASEVERSRLVNIIEESNEPMTLTQIKNALAEAGEEVPKSIVTLRNRIRREVDAGFLTEIPGASGAPARWMIKETED